MKPGKVDICLDVHKASSFTVKDTYPLLFNEVIFSPLPKAKYITSLDLKDVFLENFTGWIRIWNAFTVISSWPHLLGCAMHLDHAAADGRCHPCSLAPLNFRIFGWLSLLTFDQHLLFIELALCSKFIMKETCHLGYIGTICTDPNKVRAFADLPHPKTVKQLRRFLGIDMWYQRFLPNYTSLTATNDKHASGEVSVLLIWTSELGLRRSENESPFTVPTSPNLSPNSTYSLQIGSDLVGNVCLQV